MYFLKRKFPESICARPVGLNRCPAKAGIFYRLARRKATDLYYSAAGLRVSCSGLTPLRLSRGQTRAPCTPRDPTRAAVFFIVLFRGPSPVFFGCLGCGLRPFFFRSAGWLVWRCLVVLCAVRSSGRFSGVLCFLIGSVWVVCLGCWAGVRLCGRSSMKYGSSSIIVAYLQIN